MKLASQGISQGFKPIHTQTLDRDIINQLTQPQGDQIHKTIAFMS